MIPESRSASGWPWVIVDCGEVTGMGGGDPRSGPPASHGVCRQAYPLLSSFSFYCLTSVTEFFLLGRGSWCSTGNEITPGQLGTFGRLLPPGSGNWRLWGLTPLWRGGVGKMPGSHCVLELSSCSRPPPTAALGGSSATHTQQRLGPG